jgi:hypothetical protein
MVAVSTRPGEQQVPLGMTHTRKQHLCGIAGSQGSTTTLSTNGAWACMSRKQLHATMRKQNISSSASITHVCMAARRMRWGASGL